MVITYVDKERVDSKGNRDKRLGLVKVNVEKESGSAKCSNRKGTTATTNGKREMKKEGKDVLVKGTANWRNCNAGKYTVRIDQPGRKGYTVQGKTSVTINLEDDETQVVKFVLKNDKDIKSKFNDKKKKSEAPVTSSRRFV